MAKKPPPLKPFTWAEAQEIMASPALEGMDKILAPIPFPAPQTGAALPVQAAAALPAQPEPALPVQAETTLPAAPIQADLALPVQAEPRFTGESEPALPVQADSALPASIYWTAEGIGGVFPASRVRRIERAQDVLTHPEEAVYDVLWNPKNLARDWSRDVSMGYGEIAKKGRVSKPGLVGIMQRLASKGFIKVTEGCVTGEQKPKTYRVFSYGAVREAQRRAGRTGWIRSGNGIGYAVPISALPVQADSALPVQAEQPLPVQRAQALPVQPACTVLIDTKKRQNTGMSSASAALVEGLRELGVTDDDGARQIANAVRAVRSDVTDAEIVELCRRKAIEVKKPEKTWTGLLTSAVPKMVVGVSFEEFRTERAAMLRKQAERAEIERQQEQQRADRLVVLARVDEAWEAMAPTDRLQRMAVFRDQVDRDMPKLRCTAEQRQLYASQLAKRAMVEEWGREDAEEAAVG